MREKDYFEPFGQEPPDDFDLGVLKLFGAVNGADHPAGPDCPNVQFPELGLVLCISQSPNSKPFYSLHRMNKETRRFTPLSLANGRVFSDVVERIESSAKTVKMISKPARPKPAPFVIDAALAGIINQQGAICFDRSAAISLLREKRKKYPDEPDLFLKTSNSEVFLAKTERGFSKAVSAYVPKDIIDEDLVRFYRIIFGEKTIRIKSEIIFGALRDSNKDFIALAVSPDGEVYELDSPI